jgi:hypothetical protein
VPVKSEAAEGGGLKGQTLQARAWGETMGHEMDLQVGLSGSAFFSIVTRTRSGRRSTANSDHLSAIASPLNTAIALKIAQNHPLSLQKTLKL